MLPAASCRDAAKLTRAWARVKGGTFLLHPRSARLSTHLTAPAVGVAAVIFPVSIVGSPDTSRVLLIKRATAPSSGMWCFPGGRLELGETMAAAAAREVMEETGVHAVIPARPLAALAAHDVLDRDAASGCLRFHYVCVHVLGFAHTAAIPKSGDDAADAAWVSTDGLLDEQADAAAPLQPVAAYAAPATSRAPRPVQQDVPRAAYLPMLSSSVIAAVAATQGSHTSLATAPLQARYSLRHLLRTGCAIREVVDVLRVSALWFRGGFAAPALGGSSAPHT